LWGFFYICQMLKKILVILLFPFLVNGQSAFISGNDTICDNGGVAIIKVDFYGTPPFTFSYAIDGLIQEQLPPTTLSQYIIETKQEGIYTLRDFNDAVNIGVTSGSAIVTVLESPTAVIHIERDTLSMLRPIADFGSQSIGNVISWDWNFGDNSTNLTTEDVSHTYVDSSGIYQVSLIVFDANDCSDTANHILVVRDEFWMYIPNSFTPDNDNINDRLCIEYNGIREETFLFKVFNKQGDLMYQSQNPSELKCRINGGWDGKHIETKNNLPSDSYVYEIYFQDFEGWKHQEYGDVILIR
jgi:gliding motility-associated-like protein